ncbi:MAG TPA: HRDC domain-containing protein [Pirellulaceae bacterium]|nr:HRDC domain-containing protein [Pirellulaceae bacterium]
MQYEFITTDQQLKDYCASIHGAKAICFDTEFVSEDNYRPDLCLLQIAAAGTLAVVDTHAVEDINPFWELIAETGRETIVHAGREEFRFCKAAIGKRPHGLLDIQIAAALIGLEYPAAYGTLISRLVGKTLSKGETRTDWRRRPLSENQLTYALQDVVYLEQIRDILVEQIDKMGRRSWLETEMLAWQQQVEDAENGERWRRVSGISGMSAKSLAILRELWHWREEEAKRRNIPAKRVLRDDLLVELAKRGTADPKRISAVRGLERGDLQRHMPTIAAGIERALAMSERDYPRHLRGSSLSQLTLIGQFLSTALGSICRAAQVAPSLVGTAQDVRELIAYRLGMEDFSPDELPSLAQGWRAEVVGQKIEDLLTGKLAIRITDALSEHPLSFEPAK